MPGLASGQDHQSSRRFIKMILVILENVLCCETIEGRCITPASCFLIIFPRIIGFRSTSEPIVEYLESVISQFIPYKGYLRISKRAYKINHSFSPSSVLVSSCSLVDSSGFPTLIRWVKRVLCNTSTRLL